MRAAADGIARGCVGRSARVREYSLKAFGMPAPQPARWADALIEAELRRVCAGGDALAKARSFRRRGHRRAARGLPRPRQPLVGRAARPLHRRPAHPTQRRDGR